jgi:hypothetical protein
MELAFFWPAGIMLSGRWLAVNGRFMIAFWQLIQVFLLTAAAP